MDCTLSATLPAANGGMYEVAPNVTYTDEVTFARGPGAVLAGSAWENYPLAVQQLIFDAMLGSFDASRRSDLAGNAEAATQVRENGGSFHAMDDEAEESLKEVSQGVVQSEVEKGTLPETVEDDMASLQERWRGIAEELGYADDEGSFEDYDAWFDTSEDYVTPFAERYFEEVLLPNRPR